jgi:hypothetical protein
MKMKILTHNLIIYRNGWRWEWEKKRDNGVINIRVGDLFFWALIVLILLY